MHKLFVRALAIFMFLQGAFGMADVLLRSGAARSGLHVEVGVGIEQVSYSIDIFGLLLNGIFLAVGVGLFRFRETARKWMLLLAALAALQAIVLLVLVLAFRSNITVWFWEITHTLPPLAAIPILGGLLLIEIGVMVALRLKNTRLLFAANKPDHQIPLPTTGDTTETLDNGENV